MTKRRGVRQDDGSVIPPVILAVLTCMVLVAGLLHYGRAGDLRSEAQNAADASALGAVAQIRDEALQSLAQMYFPYASYDPRNTPPAAREYAEKNGATVTSIDYRDFFAHTVVVNVKTNSALGGFLDRFRGAKGTAKAIATVDFPMCRLVFRHLGHAEVLIGTSCVGPTGFHAFIPVGARNVQGLFRLFRLRLLAKEPPKCGLVAGTGDTVQPVQNAGVISSPYGQRGGEFHQGVDLPSNGLGSPIYAYADGIVVAAGPASGFGQWIVIDHVINGQKVSTVYGHMYPDGVLVHRGERVHAGQLIGREGSNGHSTGPHVHFEYWVGGRLTGGHSVDPAPYVQSAKPPNGGDAAAQQALTNGGTALACLGAPGPGGPASGDPGSMRLCASAAMQAGFRGEALVTITAIGMAESGCRPDATNGNTNGSTDYGLFQINTVHGYPLSCLMNATCNAEAAFRISSAGSNFYPWCTYKPAACGGNGNNSYAQYLGTARQVVAELEKKQT